MLAPWSEGLMIIYLSSPTEASQILNIVVRASCPHQISTELSGSHYCFTILILIGKTSFQIYLFLLFFLQIA